MIEILLQAERALSLGLLDRAETLYRQVADADPRNSIAVVGLARVALERGDDGESLALGRRALEIDPENSAAQRLVQRLEEVRAYRDGATVSVASEPEQTPSTVTPAPAAPAEHVPAPEPGPTAAAASATLPAGEPTTKPTPSRWRSLLDRLFRRR